MKSGNDFNKTEDDDVDGIFFQMFSLSRLKKVGIRLCHEMSFYEGQPRPTYFTLLPESLLDQHLNEKNFRLQRESNSVRQCKRLPLAR